MVNKQDFFNKRIEKSWIFGTIYIGNVKNYTNIYIRRTL